MLPTDPSKYFNKTLVVCVTDLKVFVPPTFCVRDKQSLSLCSVSFLQIALSCQHFVGDWLRQSRPKVQLQLQNTDDYFVQRTCKKTATILRPLHGSTFVSRHLQLRTGGFCCKVLLPTCPC